MVAHRLPAEAGVQDAYDPSRHVLAQVVPCGTEDEEQWPVLPPILAHLYASPVANTPPRITTVPPCMAWQATSPASPITVISPDCIVSARSSSQLPCTVTLGPSRRFAKQLPASPNTSTQTWPFMPERRNLWFETPPDPDVPLQPPWQPLPPCSSSAPYREASISTVPDPVPVSHHHLPPTLKPPNLRVPYQSLYLVELAGHNHPAPPICPHEEWPEL